MKLFGWRSAAVVAAVVGLTFGGAAAANATTEYPEGGTWNYGVYEPAGTVYVYSKYQHTYKTHGSSVRVSNGTLYRSADKLPGILASVEEATGWANNHAYYRVLS